MRLVLAVIALLVPCWIGVLVVRLLWPLRPKSVRMHALRLALGFMLGAGAVSLLVFVDLHVFGRLDARTPISAVVLLALLLLANRAVRPRAAPAAETGARPAVRVGHALLALLVAATIVLAFTGIGARTCIYPYGGWDAWSIWNVRARFLLLGGEEWRNGFCEETGVGHPDYPLLLGASVAHLWSWIGGASEKLSCAWGLMFDAAVVAALYGSLGTLRGRATGMLAAAAWCGSFSLVSNAHAQYADIPMSLGILLALTLSVLANAMREPRGLLALAGACAGCVVWTKNEGAVFAAVFFAVHGADALARFGIRAALSRVGLLAAGAAPFLAALIWFKLTLAIRNDLVEMATGSGLWSSLCDASRWKTVAQAFATELSRFREPAGAGVWSWPGPFVVVLAYGLVGTVFARRAERVQAALPAAGMALMLGAYFFVYVLTPQDLESHLATSLDRLLLQLWPSILLAVLLATRGSAEDVGPEGTEPLPRGSRAG